MDPKRNVIIDHNTKLKGFKTADRATVQSHVSATLAFGSLGLFSPLLCLPKPYCRQAAHSEAGLELVAAGRALGFSLVQRFTTMCLLKAVRASERVSEREGGKKDNEPKCCHSNTEGRYPQPQMLLGKCGVGFFFCWFFFSLCAVSDTCGADITSLWNPGKTPTECSLFPLPQS